MKKLPRLLYRYRALGRPSSDLDSDDPDAIEADTFIKSALYFPSRLQFNDKSDCLVPDMSHIADDQFREVIRQRASEELTELSVADRDLYAERMNSLSRSAIEQILQEGADCLGILSLTTKTDNPVMWAWYANNHKGTRTKRPTPSCITQSCLPTRPRKARSRSAPGSVERR